jgi:hypothetical protein
MTRSISFSRPMTGSSLDSRAAWVRLRPNWSRTSEVEQDVLGADVVVAELQGLPERQLQNFLRARRERCLRARAFLAVADDALDLLAHLVEVDVQGVESLRGDALVFAQEAEEQVLRAYVVVVEMTGLVLREHHDLAGPLRETFEH